MLVMKHSMLVVVTMLFTLAVESMKYTLVVVKIPFMLAVESMKYTLVMVKIPFMLALVLKPSMEEKVMIHLC
ncbi:hypothetical protein L4D15_20050 [Enterovibrio norvegicus]